MTETPQTPVDSKESLAEDISFGLQQTLLCLSTDAFTDPLISDTLQRKLGGKHVGHDHNLKENFVAELAGDSIGFVSFVAVSQLFRPVFDAARNGVRTVLDPFYDKLARSRLHLTGKTSLTEKEARHVSELKNFEADTLVKSNTLSLLSTVANAGVMKARGSHYSWSVLLISKFAATTITTLGMVGLRLFMPRTMRVMDNELTENYIEPVIKTVHRAAGLKHTARIPEPVDNLEAVEGSHWQDRVQQAAMDDVPPPLLTQSR